MRTRSVQAGYRVHGRGGRWYTPRCPDVSTRGLHGQEFERCAHVRARTLTGGGVQVGAGRCGCLRDREGCSTGAWSADQDWRLVRGRSLACAREVCVASSSVLSPPPALRSPHASTCTRVLTHLHTRMHSVVRRGAGAAGLPGILDMRFVSSAPDDGPSPSACTRDVPALAQSTLGRLVLSG